MSKSVILLCLGLMGCASSDSSWSRWSPPDGGPLHSKAWITTMLGQLSAVAWNTRRSIHSSSSPRHEVLGGELSGGFNDPRSVHWEFVGRQHGRDLYRVSLVEGTAVLADAWVEYAGGVKAN